MNNNQNGKVAYQYPLYYNGSIIWPLIFIFLYPPLGVFLLLLNVHFRKGDKVYYLHYKGEVFWLGFWMLIFFPIAIILAILNGFDVIELTQ